MSSTNKKRLLVIALGEATFDLIIPWIEKGELPNFKKIFEEGTIGNLESSVPMMTTQMWGNLVTGKNPGQHGLFDFWQRGNDGKFKEANGSHIKAKPIWKILSESGLSSGIVNVPFTYPPQKINGFMISGEDAPGAHRSIAHPNGLYDEIVKKFGRYRLKDIFPGGREKEDYLTLVEEDVKKQTDVLSYLIEKKNWDFFLTFYSAIAITQHYFWKDMQQGNNEYRNVIKTAYKSLDAAIDSLTKASGKDTIVFIISECGAGPLTSGVQINTWLQKEGFLTYKNSNGTFPDGIGIEQKSLEKSFMRSKVSAFRRNAQGYIPKSLFYLANKKMHWLKSWIQTYLAGSDIDWSKTYAFSRGKEGNIFINLKGRDPNGIIEESQYEKVRDQIIEKLSVLINPSTGKKVVNKIYKREELYNGPFIEFAPDLLIEWVDSAYMQTESDKDKDSIFVERWRENMNWPTSGSHRMNGILLAKGPGIAKNKKIEGSRIIDMTPTWLYMLDQKIPKDLEGRVITDLFDMKV
ncbi:MAG: alkaline phosphatase family protein [Ignavibacteria bacterium]|nr:alkaline phosphatase family protein [Ignavibacteria bacterium]